jgi:hypothetical protein
MTTLVLPHHLYDVEIDDKMMKILFLRDKGLSIPVRSALIYTLREDVIEWFAARNQDYTIVTDLDPEVSAPRACISIDDEMIALEFKLRWL